LRRPYNLKPWGPVAKSRALYQRFGQRQGLAQLLDDDDRTIRVALWFLAEFQARQGNFMTLL